MTLIDKNKLYTKLTEQEETIEECCSDLLKVEKKDIRKYIQYRATLSAIMSFKCMIYNEPSVEAIPTKKGKWKSDGYGHIICTVCNKDNVSGWKSKYCPSCGARMEMED